MNRILYTDLDFNSTSRIENLPQAVAPGQPVTYEQMNAQVEGLSWKDDVRVSSNVNITLSSPGSSIDGVTLSSGDRVLIRSQSSLLENGIYIWNSSSTPMTRSLDANTFNKLEGAVVTVTEGTSSAGSNWRQTSVNGTIDVSDVVWTPFVSTVPSASETVEGKAEIATQAETNTGLDDTKIVTPLKLASYSGLLKKYSTSFGDGSNTSFTINHNLGTLDVGVTVFSNSTGAEVICSVVHSTINSITLTLSPAPSNNAFRVVVIG